jgi:hypothetical protein
MIKDETTVMTPPAIVRVKKSSLTLPKASSLRSLSQASPIAAVLALPLSGAGGDLSVTWTQVRYAGCQDWRSRLAAAITEAVLISCLLLVTARTQRQSCYASSTRSQNSFLGQVVLAIYALHRLANCMPGAED